MFHESQSISENLGAILANPERILVHPDLLQKDPFE